MPFECVIPAAGASSRMGSWKPLLPWGASTVIETVVESALAAGLPRVILVTGFRGEELRGLFRGEPRVLAVENPCWEAGMLGSIQVALAKLSTDRFFVTPADMPLIGSEVYALLLRALSARAAPGGNDPGAGRTSFFASKGGEAGHPVLIPSRLAKDILSLDPAERLRPFLMREGHCLVEAGDRSVLEDLDLPGDLERMRLLRELRAGRGVGAPTPAGGRHGD